MAPVMRGPANLSGQAATSVLRTAAAARRGLIGLTGLTEAIGAITAARTEHPSEYSDARICHALFCQVVFLKTDERVA